MGKLIMTLLGCLVLAASPLAVAQNAAQKNQQDPTTACGARANDQNLKGKTRSSFIDACLSGDPSAAPTKKVQSDRMGDCTRWVGHRQGNDRKNFMKACLG